jgi:uncharacterized protein YkwD/putative cell wall-binding protein
MSTCTDNTPSRRRPLVFLALAVVALSVLSWWSAAAPAGAAVLNAEEIRFVELINQYRTSKGLGTLLVSPVVTKATTRHDLDMGKYSFLSHTSVRSSYFPAGSDAWDRMAAVGYKYSSTKAENIAAGYPTAAQAFNAWKGSSGHNANMLNPELKVIGVSQDEVIGSTYRYYWTTDFGSVVDSSALSVDKFGLQTQIAGPDRYDTAILVSKKSYPSGAPVVVVAKGDNFPDALAAAPLAAAYGGPVIITPSGGLTAAVKNELKRLNPKTFFSIGLSSQVTAQLTSLLPSAKPEILHGVDRYETAALVAAELKAKLGKIDKVVLVAGDKFPDALSASPLAAKNGWAILLTPQAGPLPSVTAKAIADCGASSALVVGTKVNPPVANVVYKVGTDRYQTSALVAEYAAGMGLSFGHVAMATGENFPDALVVGPYLAKDAGILVLTRSAGVPSTISDLLRAKRSAVKKLDCVGLYGAVLSQAKMALQ